jgi:hypothetical protein
MTEAEAREALRRRILEIVDRKGSLDDMAIWRESAPDYLPWKPMIEEIRTLDKEKKLRLEIVAPGHWIIHSLNATPAAAEPAPKATGKSKSSRSKKPSDPAAKKPKARARRSAKQQDEKPITQAELANLIERGYENPQVMEEHAYFLFQTGKQNDDGQPLFLCNALGAAFIARHGLEQAWAIWEAFAGSPTVLFAEDTQLSWGVISQISGDHTSSPDSLARVLDKLRAGQYTG